MTGKTDEWSDLAMREVTITGQWVEKLPQPMRRDMVRDIFSLASQYGWVVRVGGQHWEGEQRT